MSQSYSTKKTSVKKSGSKRSVIISSKKNNIKKKSKSKNNNLSDDIDENNFENKKKEIIETLREINLLTKKTMIDLKELESIHKKEIKSIGKPMKKNSGKQSGFNKPVPVPVPLQKLLKLDDRLLARSHVAKLMYKYIEENNLYSPKTKKIIIPNKEMRTIFGMKQNDVMKFENFQTWLKKVYNENDELILDIND